jgi:hypothetical protein
MHDAKRGVRLVLTSTRRMWHIAEPGTPYRTLCSRQSRPTGGDWPVFSDVCKPCQKAYDREGDTDATH